ncbi:methyl-accepting chemotaxis protein [Leptospira ilyithenensis]|uniref:Methyl-accepting chemotaxis protein n=1 Tax=Leptospira ilyithenensis TaxID=2484901 RepID=A0A4R9LT08_9LEPT|nr:methyl-accepting chemotaxis protein [Leptospira ilyithenensis]TGN14636.1 methyl-accepting chemotaxis protein [Leptospira ilyithenensis]
MFKRFSRSFFLLTEIINLIILIPFAFWFVVHFIEPTPTQLKILLGGIIAAVIVAQILQLLVSVQLKPIKIYLDLLGEGKEIPIEIFLNARNRLANFPARIVVVSSCRWFFGMIIASGPFFMAEESTVSQKVNFGGILIFTAIISILITYIVANILLRNLYMKELFVPPRNYHGESFKYQNLRVSLPILISAMMQLLLIALVLISFNSTKNAIDSAFQNQLSNINSNNSVIIEGYFKSRETDILDFVSNKQVIQIAKEKRWKELTPYLQKIYSDPMALYENNFVGSAEGIVVASRLPTGLGKNLYDGPAEADSFKFTKDQQAVFSKAFRSPVTQESVILLTAPIRDESGEVIAVAGFPFFAGKFVQSVVGGLKLGGKSGYSLLLDRDFVAIWHPNEKYTLYDFKKESLADRILNASEDSFVKYSFNGSHKALMRQYNEKYQFYFVTTIGVDEIEHNAIISMIWLSVIGILSSTFINLFVILILKTRLSGLSTVEIILERIKKGDLTEKTHPDSVDELGKLQEGLNNTIDQIADVVGANQMISEDLASSAEQMSVALGSLSANAQTQAASAEEISASIEEISAAVQNVDAQSDVQAQKVEILKTQMNHLSNIIQAMGRQVGKASEDVTEITNEAQKGQASLDFMRNSITKISESSQEIGSVIEIINNISEQINLLALNAAIEAARAGVYGRGFAVVADEIGKLADKTAQSIQDIDSLIQANEKEITNGTETIEATISLIQAIIKGVNSFQDLTHSIESNTKEQLAINQKVITEVDSVNEISRGIKLSMEEQKIAIGEVAQAIFSINDLTQSTAAGLEEMTATSNGMANLAETLKRKINFFQLSKSVPLFRKS